MSEKPESPPSIIHRLPPEISNKIAAGEVIQRPASAVRELLDNSIDAGADQLKIIIQNAGRTLIQVIDNGCGMSEEDIRLCFERHATSKIHSVDDLFKVRTLGFRGEALASIASVSQVTLKSKRPGDEEGHLFEIWGGEEKRFEPAAVEGGSSIAVRNLFYNVPARRQFLKTDATEFRHILKAIQQAALANPDIGFEVTADTDTIYDLPRMQTMKERVAEMFGKGYRASLLEFEEKTSYVNVKGLLSDPKLTKKSRGEQFLFVNGRPIQHRYLVHVILNIYAPWTGENEYPFFAVFLDVDPGQVDVNVHPAKEEVKFEDESGIIKLVRSVVKKVLNGHFRVPEIDSSETERVHSSFDTGFNFSTGHNLSKSIVSDALHLPSRINFNRGGAGDGETIAQRLYRSENEEEIGEGPSGKMVLEPAGRREGVTFWQLHNSYILTQTRTGFCLIDQHAAHKRIIYEKTLNATKSTLPSTQQLLFAQTVELSATEFSLLNELLPTMQRMGFNIQLLSGNTVLISGVPADIDIGDERSVVRSMLSQYREMEGKQELDARHKLAVAFASRTAVERGKRLTDEEMEGLLDQLFACEEPYKDPLNRPTIIYMSLEEIQSEFR